LSPLRQGLRSLGGANEAHVIDCSATPRKGKVVFDSRTDEGPTLLLAS
jgi:hypothetical protein